MSVTGNDVLFPCNPSSAMAGYVSAFAENPEEVFLSYYSVGPNKEFVRADLTRLEFWERSRLAAGTLVSEGLVKGDRFVLYMSDNRLEDLVLRLASVMVGCSPVTVNWQADTPSRVAYKVRSTGSKVVFHDSGISAADLRTLAAEFPDVSLLDVSAGSSVLSERAPPLPPSAFCSDVGLDEDRIVIFTSGTTGDPKGVRLSYRAYQCNRATFESFLGFDENPSLRFVPFLANPSHHTNTTAISDWALRRPGSHLHLLQRYSTAYWKTLAAAASGVRNLDALFLHNAATTTTRVACRDTVAAPTGLAEAQEHAKVRAKVRAVEDACFAATAGGGKRFRVVAPLVSKHFDFLDGLMEQALLHGEGGAEREVAGSKMGEGAAAAVHVFGVPSGCVSAALASPHVVVLFGSAPVGPTTVCASCAC